MSTAVGVGNDCDQRNSWSIHSGSSKSGGAPWLRKRAGIGPCSGVQRGWSRDVGATSFRKASNAAPGSGASIGEVMGGVLPFRAEVIRRVIVSATKTVPYSIETFNQRIGSSYGPQWTRCARSGAGRTAVRWLDPDEREVWLGLMRVLARLPLAARCAVGALRRPHALRVHGAVHAVRAGGPGTPHEPTRHVDQRVTLAVVPRRRANSRSWPPASRTGP